MPRKMVMSWDEKNRRWMKEYRGKKYAVSCRQLYAPETKEASYQAANDWWRLKRAELDLAGRPSLPRLTPLEQTAYASLDLPPDAWPEHAAMDRDQGDDGVGLRMVLQDLMDRLLLVGEPIPPELRRYLPPARVQQLELSRNAFRGDETTPSDRRLDYHRGRWEEIQKAQTEAGNQTPARFHVVRIQLGHFLAFVGPDTVVEAITPALIQDFFLFCLGKVRDRNADAASKAGWSVDYAKVVFSTARRFVNFLVEQGVISPPANINSRKFQFGSSTKTVPTWTVAEFQYVLKKATGQLPLHLLLMVNCGMTQIDISDLRDDEVDWAAGRITRKRSKTADQKNVPTVEYLLWPRTFKLLSEHRSGGEIVLLTESGRQWVRNEMNGPTLLKSDAVSSCFNALKERHLDGFNKPLKQLRKTAASMLETHEVYGRFTQLFLGHAPHSVADKHYARPPQKLFDEAVTWLGVQFGQVTAKDAAGKTAGDKTKGKARGKKRPA